MHGWTLTPAAKPRLASSTFLYRVEVVKSYLKFKCCKLKQQKQCVSQEVTLETGPMACLLKNCLINDRTKIIVSNMAH